mmetsp:Transcript_21782/g.60553  ORF Transcript_21782/g.60553 Transcript_21782/m.60553 type:complete len:102 (-) Transcript_21782:111-416(-)
MDLVEFSLPFHSFPVEMIRPSRQKKSRPECRVDRYQSRGEDDADGDEPLAPKTRTTVSSQKQCLVAEREPWAKALDPMATMECDVKATSAAEIGTKHLSSL